MTTPKLYADSEATMTDLEILTKAKVLFAAGGYLEWWEAILAVEPDPNECKGVETCIAQGNGIRTPSELMRKGRSHGEQLALFDGGIAWAKARGV